MFFRYCEHSNFKLEGILMIMIYISYMLVGIKIILLIISDKWNHFNCKFLPNVGPGAQRIVPRYTLPIVRSD